MKDKNIPENWAGALQKDCVTLVRDNLEVDIKKEDVDVFSPNFGATLSLIVRAMKIPK